MMQDVHGKLNPGLSFYRWKTIFTSKLDLNVGKKLVKLYIWGVALHGAETWTLLKVH
jgi:hypothetical protein